MLLPQQWIFIKSLTSFHYLYIWLFYLSLFLSERERLSDFMSCGIYSFLSKSYVWQSISPGMCIDNPVCVAVYRPRSFCLHSIPVFGGRMQYDIYIIYVYVHIYLWMATLYISWISMYVWSHYLYIKYFGGCDHWDKGISDRQPVTVVHNHTVRHAYDRKLMIGRSSHGLMSELWAIQPLTQPAISRAGEFACLYAS